MKQFFKFMFASMLGTILTLILIGLFLGIIIAAAVSMSKDTEKISEKSVLHLKLNKSINDRNPNDPFSFSSLTSFGEDQAPSLTDYLKQLRKASKDDKIKGIYLDMSNVPSNMATVLEIREALQVVKDSGKFILAYGEMYSQKAYYLATVADEIYLNPEGLFIFQGLSTETMYLKGLLEKLDIEVQYSKRGKYKSALEALVADSMSEAATEQIAEVIDDFWGYMCNGISSARDISVDDLNLHANQLSAFYPEDAVEIGFFDGTKFMDEIIDMMKAKLELGEDDKLKLVTIGKYKNVSCENAKKSTSRDKIAVIFAQGSIESGKGDDMTIGSDRFAKAIRKARNDDKVKAIVLRVNSPGGSGLASDVILREIKLAKEEKPVVVSFGGVAASGGYYIACAADTIVALPTTITGSIGVFWLMPNFEGFWKNKLGIGFDGYKTNKYADFPSTNRSLNNYEFTVLDKFVEKFYQTFLKHVAEGRDMTVEEVHEIAQGRIWSGEDALDNGLIDVLGGLQMSIEIAAEMAGLEDYRIKELPTQKDPFDQIMESIKVGSKHKMIERELGEYYKYYVQLREYSSMSPIQARMPYTLEIE